jgi:hypothetical protein
MLSVNKKSFNFLNNSLNGDAWQTKKKSEKMRLKCTEKHRQNEIKLISHIFSTRISKSVGAEIYFKA